MAPTVEDNRKHSRCDIEAVVKKYCNGTVNISEAKLQYSVYRNDESLNFLLLNCENQPDAFFANYFKYLNMTNLDCLLSS